MYFLYNLLWALVIILSAPFFIYKLFSYADWRRALREKLGFVPEGQITHGSKNPCIWVHAVSMGEVSAIHPLIRHLATLYPRSYMILTTSTESGQKIAREQVKEASLVSYAPLDLSWAVRRSLQRWQPDLLIIAETEIWPNLLRIAKEKGVRTMLANGRISARSYRRYRRTRFFWAEVLDYFDVLSMIRVQDGDRIIAMGANPVKVFVNGNCKYDQAIFKAEKEFKEEMQNLLSLREEDLVFVAGSTHDGEEEVIVQTFLRLRQEFPSLILIIVPRHIDRVPKIEKLVLDYRAGEFARRSQLSEEGRKDRRLIIWDTFGELSKVYSIATLVFCGGSLVPKRGQNILEPVAWGKVVFYGPSIEDFQDAHELLQEVGAGFMVKNFEELVERSLYFLSHPAELQKRGEAGKEILAANLGAAQRNAELARRLLENEK
ncbi:MAG: 3-deoxy-D-manno-octulosonic acid transferase [Thermodesulfobacteriota bacterium]